MNVDISFHPKEHMVFLKFKVSDFESELQNRECLAIVAVFSGDFHLDPELEINDISGFTKTAKEKDKAYLIFELCEEGLELELA
jgi:hypothetical protein